MNEAPIGTPAVASKPEHPPVVDAAKTEALANEIMFMMRNRTDASPKPAAKERTVDDLLAGLKTPSAEKRTPEAHPSTAASSEPAASASNEAAPSTEKAPEAESAPKQLGDEDAVELRVTENLNGKEGDIGSLVDALHFTKKQLTSGNENGAANLVRIADSAASITKYEDFYRIHREIIAAAKTNPSVDLNAVGLSIARGLEARLVALPAARTPNPDPMKEAELKEEEHKAQSELVGATRSAAEDMVKAHMFEGVDALIATLQDPRVMESMRGRSSLATEITADAAVEQAVVGDMAGMRARVDALRSAEKNAEANDVLQSSAVSIARTRPDDAISLAAELPVFWRERCVRELASACAAKDADVFLDLVRARLDNKVGQRDSALGSIAATIGKTDAERAFAVVDEMESAYIRNNALFEIGASQTDGAVILKALEKMGGSFQGSSDNSMEALARIALNRARDTQDRSLAQKVEGFISTRKAADQRATETARRAA